MRALDFHAASNPLTIMTSMSKARGDSEPLNYGLEQVQSADHADYKHLTGESTMNSRLPLGIVLTVKAIRHLSR